MHSKDDIVYHRPVGTMNHVFADELDVRKDRDWLNPISMSTLKHAVAKKRTTCVLNGDEFTIEYGHITKLPLTGDRPCVLVFRTDERFSAPMGYIALETLKNFKFEDAK